MTLKSCLLTSFVLYPNTVFPRHGPKCQWKCNKYAKWKASSSNTKTFRETAWDPSCAPLVTWSHLYVASTSNKWPILQGPQPTATLHLLSSLFWLLRWLTAERHWHSRSEQTFPSPLSSFSPSNPPKVLW